MKLLEPTIDEEELATAHILQIFEMRGEKIAGCKVNEGRLDKEYPVHLVRNDKILGDLRVKTLRQGKVEVNGVDKGDECGITFSGRLDFKVGDVIKSYKKISEN